MAAMFFYLSKIIGTILSPLNFILLLLAAGVFLLFLKRPRAGTFLAALSFIAFLIFGILPTGHNMLVLLENKYARPAEMPDWVNVIFVPGGSFETSISEGRGMPSLNDSADRITDAIALANKHLYAMLIFSGGNASLLKKERTESEDAAQFFHDLGFASDRVLYEDQSRNTYENIKFTRDLFTPLPDEKWVVVTSAYHMPRTLAVMKNLKWQGDIIPYPSDYRTDGKFRWIPENFNILGNMYDSHVAIHEYLGLAAYYMGGKISLPGQS